MFRGMDRQKNSEILFISGFIAYKYQDKFTMRTIVEGEFTLVLNRAQMSDGGTYTCVDNNGVGPENGSAEIIILGK